MVNTWPPPVIMPNVFVALLNLLQGFFWIWWLAYCLQLASARHHTKVEIAYLVVQEYMLRATSLAYCSRASSYKGVSGVRSLTITSVGARILEGQVLCGSSGAWDGGLDAIN